MMYKGKKLTFQRIVNGVKCRIGIIFFNKLFTLWERLGFHITKNHFHQPIPDTRTLKDELWQNHSKLVGINFNEQGQLKLFSDLVSKKDGYNNLPVDWGQSLKPYEYYINNGQFGAVDGEILYCMIRHFKPKRIFEIGSGYSTYLSAQAILKNKEDYGNDCELIAFEPYPNDVLNGGFPGLSKLIPTQIQNIPVSQFSELEEDDILFIDSSHVLKIGSDVQYEYLEILPRLNKGVIIHLHDIFLPLEYPREWVLKMYRFWTEQYLLQAFLSFNNNFEVLWSGSFMHLNHPDKLEVAFSSYKRDRKWPPGSFWMRKIR